MGNTFYTLCSFACYVWERITSKYKAYSENKGEKLAFCLNVDEHDNEELIDGNTLLFVAIHELAHISSVSVGHNDEFWDNFKWLLVNAKEGGIHQPHDFKKNPKEYCGMQVTDNPYYDRDWTFTSVLTDSTGTSTG